jgi:hypothetical protein
MNTRLRQQLTLARVHTATLLESSALFPVVVHATIVATDDTQPQIKSTSVTTTVGTYLVARQKVSVVHAGRVSARGWHRGGGVCTHVGAACDGTEWMETVLMRDE